MTTRVLWVTEEVPGADGTGGAIRQASLLAQLAQLRPRLEIDLLVAGPVVDARVRDAVRSVIEVETAAASTLGRARVMWELGVRGRPMFLAASAPAVRALEPELRRRAPDYDLVVVHHENLLPLLAACGSTRSVLHVFDVKALRAEQAAGVASTRRQRILLRAEARASRRAVRRWLRFADGLVTCTAADRDALVAGTTLAPDDLPASIVAPNGVDLERFAPSPAPGRARVLFLGSLDYEPNVDGVTWFAGAVWPRVRSAFPAAELTIAGRRPSRAVRALGGAPGVTVEADVPDAPACLATADVVVVPLRVGTGSRLKALEAMASGRPTVGTTIGLEGLQLEGAEGDGPPALVADDEGELAAAVAGLLASPDRAAAVGAAGRAHVATRFGWEAVAAPLAAALAAVASGAAPPRAADPGVSVLVCTRGRAALLPDALASISADLGPADELLVVESDGDGAARAVDDLEVRARHLAAPRPGKSRQLNQGVLAAAHDVIVLTDDDCRVDRGWVAAMAAPFADPTVGVVFGPVTGLSGVRGVPEVPLPAGEPPGVTWEYANGAAMAVRRSAVLAVGGYDERLGPGAPVHGEEHDLLLRLLEAGWRARVADAPAVRHLEWRGDEETRENLLTYSRGAGAFLGAALRRAPRRSARLLVRRVRYQASLWGHAPAEGRSFGPATSAAFARGLLRGLLMRPRRFLG